MLITGTAAISYFAMATNTGYSLVDIGVHFLDGVDRTVLRQVFWARFIGWAVISPLLLLTFCLLSGCPLIDAVAIMITDLTMIITASITMLTPGYRSSKWVWFIFTMVLFFYILGKLLWDCRKSAKMQSADTASLYNSLYIFTFIVWIMYPIFFVLGEITYTISCDLQSVAFTVLDLLAEAVFVVWLIFGHKYSSQHPSVLPEWSVEVRGAKRGQIHLQGDDPVGHVVPAPAPAPAPGHPAAEAHHV
jgi:bacteriorhodopsin